MDRPGRPLRKGKGHESPIRAVTVAGTDGSDSELVDRAVRDCQAGIRCEANFSFLYETFFPEVRSFFLRRLSASDDWFDLTQETFTRVYTRLKDYRGDGPFAAWLFCIARNILRSGHHRAADPRIRGRRVDAEKVGEEVEATVRGAGPSHAGNEGKAFVSILRREQRRILRRAIAKLPPQRRRCIVLWAYHELTYEEIAVVMNLSIGTVKAHLAQARKQLAGLVVELVGAGNSR